ncbi:MAG: sulfotransferase [Rhodospirillales bacterium]|nr:sulfotransferase [Rhodospirillales bacterium]
MIKGFVDSITHRLVDGWAADPDAPDRVVKVAVMVDGHPYATMLADRFRADLAENPALFGSGHHAFVYSFPVPLSPHKEHRISVVACDTGEPLRQGEALLAPARILPELQPVLVTAPGRSGTTQMMNRLSQATAIVAGELYPFETRLIAYYGAVYKVLTAPADLARSTHPDRLEGDGFHVGSNPFRDGGYAPNFGDPNNFNAFFSAAVPHTLAETLRSLILSYYALLAGDQGKRGVRFLAEKNNNLDDYVSQFMRLLFGSVREIVMLRDPRDLLTSQLSYFAGAEVENSIVETTESCRLLRALRKQARPDTLFVRYEEMIFRPAATFRQISDFLGTEVPEAGESEREASIFQEHATSASPVASVGRWRRDLAPEIAERCTIAWADFLTDFGYDDEEEFAVPE